MYANGQGVSKDKTEAMKWYRLAADQGRSDAQYQLGHLSYQQNNYAEAAKWFRLAAEQGRPDAQSNLGVMYAEGEGVPQDDVQALMWFTLAAEQNHKDAMENRDINYDGSADSRSEETCARVEGRSAFASRAEIARLRAAEVTKMVMRMPASNDS